VIRSQIAGRSLTAIIALTAFVYLADYLVLRFRSLHPTPSMPFESMTRTRVLAISMKNGKYDYQIDRTQPVEVLTCVHSLFPHYGDKPCWYIKPRLHQPIPIE
jgi:hypothetical protein